MAFKRSLLSFRLDSHPVTLCRLFWRGLLKFPWRSGAHTCPTCLHPWGTLVRVVRWHRARWTGAGPCEEDIQTLPEVEMFSQYYMLDRFVGYRFNLVMDWEQWIIKHGFVYCVEETGSSNNISNKQQCGTEWDRTWYYWSTITIQSSHSYLISDGKITHAMISNTKILVIHSKRTWLRRKAEIIIFQSWPPQVSICIFDFLHL